MKQKVTAVFDIGKTNKKFFLFNEDFKQVHKEYIHFDEIVDEDGFPTENLPALQKWLKEVFSLNLYFVLLLNSHTRPNLGIDFTFTC